MEQFININDFISIIWYYWLQPWLFIYMFVILASKTGKYFAKMLRPNMALPFWYIIVLHKEPWLKRSVRKIPQIFRQLAKSAQVWIFRGSPICPRIQPSAHLSPKNPIPSPVISWRRNSEKLLRLANEAISSHYFSG